MNNQNKEYKELAYICLVFDKMPQILQFSLIGTMIESYCCQHKLNRDIVITDLREVSKEVERKHGKFSV